jgi:hypothetical protein
MSIGVGHILKELRRRLRPQRREPMRPLAVWLRASTLQRLQSLSDMLGATPSQAAALLIEAELEELEAEGWRPDA